MALQHSKNKLNNKKYSFLENGRKYFPFRITPRFSFVRDGRVYSQPSRFGGDTFYRFLDSNPSFSNQYLTYEEHLLHPYGVVYLDEAYILSHSEFIAGFQFFQYTTDSTGTRIYKVPHWYDPYVFDFSESYSPDTAKGFARARGDYYAIADDSLTLADYLDLPFSL